MAITGGDGQLKIKTTLDAAEFAKQLGTLESVAKPLVAGLVTVIAGAATAVAGIGVAAIKTGIEYESAFAGVRKTTEATEAEFAAISAGLRDLSHEMPQTATQLAGIAEAAGQLGIAKEDILSFTKTMAQLGDATNLTSEEAATSLARFANITGMMSDEYDKLGSVIVDLGNNLATTESEIVEMAMRIAGAGTQVGMTESQIMAFSGALSSVGISAEAGGTAFSTLMSKMSLAAAQGGEDLSKFAKVAGMSADDFKTAFEKDAGNAILSFIKGLDRINQEGGSAIQTLDDMSLSDIRMRDALLRSAGATGVFEDALSRANKAWDENSALAKEAEQRYETTESKISMLKNTIKDLGISIFEDARNPLRELIDTAMEMSESLHNAFEEGGFEGLATQVGIVIAEIITKLGEAAPQMIEMGGKMLRGILQGIIDNKDAIIGTVKTVILAIGDTIASLLPETSAQAVKNLATGLTNLIDPALKVAGAILKVVDALSPLLPLAVALVVSMKGWSAMQTASTYAKALAGNVKTLATATSTESTATKIATLNRRADITATFAQTSATKAGAVAANLQAVGYKTQAVALRASTIATTAATTATKALSAAFAANPIGLIVTGITLLISVLAPLISKHNDAADAISAEAQAAKDLREKTDDLTKTYRDNAQARKESLEDATIEVDQTKELIAKTEELANKTNKTNVEKALLADYIDRLNESIPDLNLAYDEEAGVLNKTTEELHAYVDAIEREVRAEASRKGMLEAMEQQLEIEKQLRDARVKAAEDADAVRIAQEKYNQALTDQKNATGSDIWNRKAVEDALEVLKEAEDVAAVSASSVSDLEDEFKNAGDEIAYFGEMMNRNLVDMEALFKDAAEAGIEVPTKIAEGIREGSLLVPQTLDELKATIEYGDMIEQAGLAGTEWADALRLQMLQGKFGPSEAANEAQALIQFSDMYNAADAAGKTTMDVWKASMEAGSMLPSEAAKLAIDQFGALTPVVSQQATNTGNSYIDGLSGAIKGQAGDVSSSLDSMLDQGVNAANKTGAAGMQTMGKDLPKVFASSATANKGLMSRAVDGAVDGAITSGTGISNSRSPGMGAAIPQGAASGVGQWSYLLSNAVTNMVDSALAAGQSRLAINSPSKVFRDKVGASIPEGAALGVDQSAYLLADAVVSMAEAAQEAAEDNPVSFPDPEVPDPSDLRSRILALGADLPKIRAELEAAVYSNVSKLPGTSEASVSAVEDPNMDDQIILRADITAEIDGEAVSKTTSRYVDIDLGRISNRKGY